MKKLAVSIFALVISVYSFAQTNDFEVGFRLILDSEVDVFLDMAKPLKGTKRLHGDLSFDGGVGINLLLNWQYGLTNDNALQFYYGFGGGTFIGDPFLLAAVGEVGVEYRFDIPLSLSMDYRPNINIIKDSGMDAITDIFGINVRYRF